MTQYIHFIAVLYILLIKLCCVYRVYKNSLQYLRIRTRFLWNRLRTSSHGGDDERINESITKDGLPSSGIQETRIATIALNGTNEMFTTAKILIKLLLWSITAVVNY